MHTNVLPWNWTNGFTLAMACLVCFAGGTEQSFADDWGSVDGAIWRVTLTPQIANRGPREEKAVTMRGHYRVEKLVLYQSEGRKDKELGRKIGKSNPIPGAKRPTTDVELSDFQVHNRESNVHLKLNGKARLVKVEKEQKATGVFVEDKGWKWDMEVTRIKE